MVLYWKHEAHWVFSNFRVLKNSWNQQFSREPKTPETREIFPTQVKAVVSHFSNINIKAVTLVADEHSCPVAATRHLVSCTYVFVFQSPDSPSEKNRGQKLTRQEVGTEEEEKTFTLSSANVSVDTFPPHLLRRNSPSFSRVTHHSVTVLTFDMHVVNCQKTGNYSRNKKRQLSLAVNRVEGGGISAFQTILLLLNGKPGFIVSSGGRRVPEHSLPCGTLMVHCLAPVNTQRVRVELGQKSRPSLPASCG